MKNCNFCLDENQEIEVGLSCGHQFHKKCLKEWIETCISFSVHPTCPFCRAGLEYQSTCEIFSTLEADDLIIPNLINGLQVKYGNLKCVEECKIVIVKIMLSKNTYSFTLYPASYQPSGTCNYSRIDNITLEFKAGFRPETYQPSGTINCS